MTFEMRTIFFLVIATIHSSGVVIGAMSPANGGCFHNGTVYAEKSLVPTVERCLACQCLNKTLVCALKVCPEFIFPPPRGCVLVKSRNACCSYLSCKTHNKAQFQNHVWNPEFRGDSEESEDINIFRRSDEIDLFEETEACVSEGSVYRSGSAMVSKSSCNLCYCFAGKRICVQPKCLLPDNGCQPVFVPGSCCPIYYECANKGKLNVTRHAVAPKETNELSKVKKVSKVEKQKKCHDSLNNVYSDGQKMPGSKSSPCQTCFCIRGNTMCVEKECAKPISNCVPVIPEGQCCAVSYDCSLKKNETTRSYKPKSEPLDLFSLLFGEKKVDLKEAEEEPETTEKADVFDKLLSFFETKGREEEYEDEEEDDEEEFWSTTLETKTLESSTVASSTSEAPKPAPEPPVESTNGTQELLSTTATAPLTTTLREIRETTTEEETQIINTSTEIHLKLEESPATTLETGTSEVSTTSVPEPPSTVVPFRPLKPDKPDDGLLSTLMDIVAKTKNATAPKPPQVVTTEKQPGSNLYRDYDEQTLPSDIPFIQMIPFVPDDAVQIQVENPDSYYHAASDKYTSPSEGYSYWGTDDGNLNRRHDSFVVDDEEEAGNPTGFKSAEHFLQPFIAKGGFVPRPHQDPFHKFNLPPAESTLKSPETFEKTVGVSYKTHMKPLNLGDYELVQHTTPSSAVQWITFRTLPPKMSLQNLGEFEHRAPSPFEASVTAVELPKIVSSTKPPPVDPLSSLLRVSGCNIYGELYKIGELINVLVEDCKECKCTETGVVCKSVGCDKNLVGFS